MSAFPFAQTIVTPANTDFFASFGRDIAHIVNGPAEYLVGYVSSALDHIALALLVVVLATAGWEAVSGSRFLNIDYIVRKFYVPYGLAVYFLAHWFTPIPGLGMSFIDLFTNLGEEISAHIDLSALDMLNQHFEKIRDSLGDGPGFSTLFTGGFSGLYYIAVLASMMIIKGVIFVVTAFGFVAVGVGAGIGPLFLLAYIIPPLRHFWFSWVNAMIEYTLYRVVASMVVAIWCSALVNYFDRAIHGDYGFGHLMAISLEMIPLMIAMCYSILKIPSIVSSMAKGHGGAGDGMAGSVVGFVKGAFL